jgi:hypothetical protein
MTSVLNVDTIAAKNGTDPVALTKQSAAKVWGLYDQTNNVTDSSFGTSSITDSSTGRFNVAFTNTFSSRPAISGLNTRRSYYNLSDFDAITTSDVDLATDESSTSARDRDENCFVAHGDLA